MAIGVSNALQRFCAAQQPLENFTVLVENGEEKEVVLVSFVAKRKPEMSRAYAQGTCGLVRGVVGKDLRSNNIWEGYERETLMNNSAVSQIDIIDPKSERTKTIFKR